MKFDFVVFWLVIISTSSFAKVVDKKVFVELDATQNFGVIEEDVIYKINEKSKILNEWDKNKKKKILISKFIPNVQGNYKYFEVHPLLNSTLLGYNVKKTDENMGVMIESQVEIGYKQENVGLSYTYEVFNIFKYDNISQITDVTVGNSNAGEDVTVEFNIFLTNFPLEINEKNLILKGHEYQLAVLEGYKMRHLGIMARKYSSSGDLENEEDKATIDKTKTQNISTSRPNHKFKNLQQASRNNSALRDGGYKGQKVYKIKYSARIKKNSTEKIALEIKGLNNTKKRRMNDNYVYGSKGGSTITTTTTSVFHNSPYTYSTKYGYGGYPTTGGYNYKIVRHTHYGYGNNDFVHIMLAVLYIACLCFICYECCNCCAGTSTQDVNYQYNSDPNKYNNDNYGYNQGYNQGYNNQGYNPNNYNDGYYHGP